MLPYEYSILFVPNPSIYLSTNGYFVTGGYYDYVSSLFLPPPNDKIIVTEYVLKEQL